RFSELLAYSDIPKSSLSALLKTLRESDYIYFNQNNQTFYPTSQWKVLLEKIFQGDPLSDFPDSLLIHLSKETGETALLARLSNDKVCYVKVAEPDRIIRFSAKPGDTRPIYSTSSGRAILSSLSPSAFNEYSKTITYQQYTELTPKNSQELLERINAEKAQGWHENLGENENDTASASVYCNFNGVSTAIVIGSPQNRFIEK